jgi:hypothetical protein
MSLEEFSSVVSYIPFVSSDDLAATFGPDSLNYHPSFWYQPWADN